MIVEARERVCNVVFIFSGRWNGNRDYSWKPIDCDRVNDKKEKINRIILPSATLNCSYSLSEMLHGPMDHFTLSSVSVEQQERIKGFMNQCF